MLATCFKIVMSLDQVLHYKQQNKNLQECLYLDAGN